MTRSEKFIKKVLIAEGGDKVTDDPSDSGGLTKYGISQKSFPDVDIRNLTEADVISIYKKIYYDPCKCDFINDELLALHVFDFAVNAGIGRAIKTLQSVAYVNVDGIIGNKTIEKVNSGSYSDKYKQARIDYYNSIGKGKNAKFLKGWINRVNNLKV